MSGKAIKDVQLSVNDKTFVILSSEVACVKVVQKLSMHSIFYYFIHTLIIVLVLL